MKSNKLSKQKQTKPLDAKAVREIALSVFADFGIQNNGGVNMYSDVYVKFGNIKKSQQANLKLLTDKLASLKKRLEYLQNAGVSGAILRSDSHTVSEDKKRLAEIKELLPSLTDIYAAEMVRQEISRLEIKFLQNSM